MLIPTLIMAALAAALLAVAYAQGEGKHLEGVKSGLQLMVQILPLLFLALLVAGLFQAILPHRIITAWIGGGSGLRGILVGTVAGGLAPGGPYVSLPIAAGLLHAGAGVGTMVSFLTGWSLWAISRLPMDVGVLGWRLAAIRFACTFFFPPIAGLLAATLFGKVNLQ